MTDRYDYLLVALDRDVRSDDAADLITAIKTLKGVLHVEPHIANADAWLARTRVRAELVQKIGAILRGEDS